MNLYFIKFISTICFISFVAVINTQDLNETGESKPNGTFTVNEDGTVGPGISWNYTIPSNTTKNILIVIEEMLLDRNDNLTIINDSKNIDFYSGMQVPFTLLIKTNHVQLLLETSTNQVKRIFKGFYNLEGCKYIIRKDTGSLSTPLIYGIDNVNCLFVLNPSETSYSKRSITFLNSLSDAKVQVNGSGSQDSDYTGSDIPEIIGKDANTDLTLTFTLQSKDKNRVNFTYENVREESEFVKLSGNQTVKEFKYNSSVESVYQPEITHCHWIIESDEKTIITLKITNLTLTKGAHIIIGDGNNGLAKPIKQISSLDNNLDGTYVLSTGKSLRISLIPSDGKIEINAEAKSHNQGGYFENKGAVHISKSEDDVIYLLEVNENENVVLNSHEGKLLPNSSIQIFNDFSIKAKSLLVLNDIPNYPVISDTSRMMIIAKNFNNTSEYKANFEGIIKGCYKMTSQSSYDYVIDGYCKKECKWVVLPDNSYDTISLHMHLLHFDVNDIITIDLLDKTKVFDVRSKEAIPEIYLPAKLGFVMTTKDVTCNKTETLLHVNFEKLNGCDKVAQLAPGKKLQIMSPNYPNTYPILADCWSNITSTNNNTSKEFFHVAFEKLALSKLHCLKFWEDFKQKNATAKIFSGVRSPLPDDLLFRPDLAVEFISKPCNNTGDVNLNTESGFSLNVTSADCGGTIIAKEGNFSTPNYPNMTASKYCIWLLEVPPSTDIHHPNIINFTVIVNGKKDFKLDIYDGGSVRDNIKNISTKEMLSRTNKLVFVYERMSAQPSSSVTVKFHSHNCNVTCQNHLCLHAAWVCNGINDCGDNTDELNCSHQPLPPVPPVTPTPKPSTAGVSPLALWFGLPIVFILGILAAVFVPPLYRRFRSSQYHQFRDISAEA